MASQSEAVTIFIDLVMKYVYSNSMQAMNEYLTGRASSKTDRSEMVDLRNWYSNLTNDQKKILDYAIDRAISGTIFSFLVLLDNKTTGYPLGKTPSDFALYIQSYEGEDNLYDYKPSEQTRINMSYSEEDLHDIFLRHLLLQHKGDKDS